ncbi:MAG TPA: D-aminoacylase [Chthonomonadaceae bacterium]|nr:D-aminoacylase [Chthonomonadaceae bacterium]
MRSTLLFLSCLLVLFGSAPAGSPQDATKPSSILIIHGLVIDGTGAKRRRADVRIVGDTIREVGDLKPLPGERILDAEGLVVAPGFIDTHSHADGGLLEDPLAETQIRQGITTSVVGQDGGSHLPLKDWFAQLETRHVALNIASFVGHGTLRNAATGSDYKRHVTPAELEKMRALMAQEMQAGGLGLSSGLEYDPGFYSTTEELIACAQVAGQYGGLYISHVRDEGDEAFASFKELIRIAEEGHLPAQISHIKLDTSPVWNKAGDAIALMEEARKRGLDITADVYPYTYWQSTIIVIIPTRDWEDRKAWEKGLAEVGGPSHVLLSSYTPDPAWAGKTLAEISATTHKDPITVIQEIVHKTHAPGAEGRESVVVTAMTEDDVRRFIADPHIMFCSDGGLKGTHPRGAGSFPRVLGRYVREKRALTLEEAIHKMTALAAARMSFADRGQIAVGKKADVVLLDPKKVLDTATTAQPTSAPVGIPTVLVNGVPVLENGQFTGERPGMVLRHAK